MTQARILAEIKAERDRQDAKWGEQNHPLVHKSLSLQLMLGHYGVHHERYAKLVCDTEHREGRGTYGSIIVEELSESLCAAYEHGNTSPQCREELIQLAAVVVGAIEAIDRKAGR